jgi:hypothetical protein
LDSPPPYPGVTEFRHHHHRSLSADHTNSFLDKHNNGLNTGSESRLGVSSDDRAFPSLGSGSEHGGTSGTGSGAANDGMVSPSGIQ